MVDPSGEQASVLVHDRSLTPRSSFFLVSPVGLEPTTPRLKVQLQAKAVGLVRLIRLPPSWVLRRAH
jgi:hypothetical protein